jgi:CheY-like chemotaxis protein
MGNGVTILVVEDEEAIQDILEIALEDGGYVVAKAFSAERAIELIDVHGRDIRALISDINLVGSNLTGWEVAKYARHINNQLPIVYMTGGNAHEWGSMGVPKSVLLVKPFAPAQMISAVSQLLNMEQGS